MAFGQNLQFGVKNPINTGFNANFGFSLPKTTTKSNDHTYDSRYPGFDEDDYKKLERLANEKGVTGKEKTQLMDQLYQYYYPQVANSHKLDERQVELNRMTYDNDGKEPGNMSIKLSGLAQSAKQKYNIDASVNDNELLGSIVDATPNGQKLLEDYINNGNPEFLYAAGIEDRPQQGGVKQGGVQQGGLKALVNPADEDRIVAEGSEWYNPVGAVAETVDNAATKFADKWLDWGNSLNEWGTETLKEKLDNMSEKEIEAYRKKYQEMLKDKDLRVARVEGDTVVEQLWNAVKGDLKYDYKDEDFEKWLIEQKANLGEYMVGADDVLQGETNPNVIQFFGNIPSSAVKTFTATVRGLTNPYDTMKGLYKIALTEEGHQAILDRYGSWDAFAKAMNTDPVGVADDILAVAEGLTSIAKGGLKATGKITGNQKFTNRANDIGKLNVGSANDALAQQTMGKVYGVMDNLAGDNTLLKTANRYMQDVSSISKTIENAKSDFDSIRGKANEWADNIIQNNNRMTKKQQENFKKMSGEDQGKWMNDRNIRTQEDLVDYFIESKNKVDDAMGKIEGQFTSKELTTVLDDSIEFAKKTENKDLGRLQELQTKNANGGLTMSEINEVKRFYEKNNKFNYLKEGTAEKSALATNRDNALREWQQKIANENGLDNLKELNKETQAAKFLADNATNWQSGIKGNNPISLTDWIVASGGGLDANGILNVVGKKIFTAPRFQNKLVDVLNYIGGHETKGEINPNYQAIDMKNYEKRILAEELAKVKSEKEFQAWLDKAQEMAGPALPYDARYDGQAPIDYSTPTIVTPGGKSVRAGQIAEI